MTICSTWNIGTKQMNDCISAPQFAGLRDRWSYMLGAGVPSDHLFTPTRKTDSGGKDLSCG